MAPKDPLRLGIIGLSSSAATSWAARAHLPALTSPEGRAHYTIVALCNSSTDAAQAAIKTYDLDAHAVKAYGTPTDLAADEDVEVVSCNVRVDNHYKTILPSIKAGKSVYLEWPIASNGEQVAEIVEAARASGSRVAIGLQGRWAPPVVKVREVLHSGIIGRVLSSELRAYGGLLDRQSIVSSLQYFTHKAVGGNAMLIGLGHAIDIVQSVVGELDPATTNARWQIQRPKVNIVEGTERKIIEVVDSDVPDLISIHGGLQRSSIATEDATLIASFRVGQPFPGQPALQWTINCERGEIRVLSPKSAYLNADAYQAPVTVHLHEFATDKVEELPWSWAADQEHLPVSSRNVARCLYALADGDESGYVGLEDAARRAEQIYGWLNKKTHVAAL